MKKAFRFIFVSISTLFLLSCASNTNTYSKYSYEPVDDSDLENMAALQFTQVIGNGINLGNTFEATGAGWMGYNASPNQYETAWGQPVTTKAMFEAMKSAGFDCVRIPVAWTSTMNWRENDYEINENFMNRIKEVVGWALDSGLYVMINDHWDYGWWGLFGSDKQKPIRFLMQSGTRLEVHLKIMITVLFLKQEMKSGATALMMKLTEKRAAFLFLTSIF